MALPARNPVLPTVSLYLGVAAAALIPIGFIVGTLGIFLGLAWRPAPLITGGIAGLAFVSSPGLAIAAIVSGHMSRRRYPTEGFGRAGLITGYVVLGLLVLVGGAFVLAWKSIR